VIGSTPGTAILRANPITITPAAPQLPVVPLRSFNPLGSFDPLRCSNP